MLAVTVCGGGLTLAAPADPSPTTLPSATVDTSEPEAGLPEMDLDVAALLAPSGGGSPAVAALREGPWELKGDGRLQYLMVPLLPPPTTQPRALSILDLKVRGGRAVAWRLGEGPVTLLDKDGETTWREGLLSTGTGKPVNLKVPRWARRMELEPGGTLAWDLERAIPGAAAIDNHEDLYALKLRPDLLREHQPARPAPLTRGSTESAADFAARRRADDEQFRARTAAVAELRRNVMTAPTRFRAKAERLWALVEIRAGTREITIQGPCPEPWTLNLPQVDDLRKLAVAGAAANKPEDWQALAAWLATNPHPYNHRLVAHAVAQAGLPVPADAPADAEPATLAAAQAVLQGPDGPARHRVLEMLRGKSTPATLTLLETAARCPDPVTRFRAVGLMMAARPDTATPVLRDLAGKLLAQEDGPPVASLLQELMLLTDQGGLAPAVALGIDVASLPASRREPLIQQVVREAARRPLARALLEKHLLDPAKPDLVKAALTALLAGQTAPAATQPRTAAYIVLTRDQQAFLGLLRKADAELATLAWQALPLFALGHETLGGPDDLLKPLMEAALARKPTPVQAVAFVLALPEPVRAADELLTLILKGKGPAVARACQAVRGTDLPLAFALARRPAAEREAFGRLMYEHLSQGKPLVVGLLRQDAVPAIEWFARSLSQGELPAPGLWAQALDENKLLPLVLHKDQAVALAATAALVAGAGGDDLSARRLAAAFGDLKSPDATTLKKTWTSARPALVEEGFRKAAGTYRLALQPPARSGTDAPAPLDLGEVKLVSEGSGLRAAGDKLAVSTPPARFVLRIDNPAELKACGGASTAALPLEKLTDPILLYHHADGAWRSRVKLPDGNSIEVTLTPVKR